jgi:hypothetical protein
MLITPIGEPFELGGEPDHIITNEDHENAVQYFRRCKEEVRRWKTTPSPLNDDTVTSDPSVVYFDHRNGDHAYLGNDYAAPITLDEGTFPTVEHAYWTLATTDPAAREQIVAAPNARQARNPEDARQIRPLHPRFPSVQSKTEIISNRSRLLSFVFG